MTIMKCSTKTNHAERGSVLAITLFLAFLFGFFLFYYLSLASGQKKLVKRSQAWNAAMGMAEAGAEEALAQLNPGAPQPVLDLTANGWGAPAGGLYGPMSRSLSNGSYSVVYTTDPLPTIYSTGYVTIPSLSAQLTRTIKITTRTYPLFAGAMSVLYNINLNGNGVTTDSFDSSNTNLSTNGRYDPSKTSTNGTIASLLGIVNVGNANIHGSVLLGPTASSSVQANGFVTGGITNDFNASFEDVVLPASQPLPAVPASAPVTIDGVTYQYVFGYNSPASGYYHIGGLSANIYVGTNSHITLLINGNANAGVLRVAGAGPTAGQLTIYMDGPNFNINSSSAVDGGYAASLSYYGTTNNTSFSLGANANFTGTIYAPEAAVHMSGGGSATYNFVGALVAKTVIMTGHFFFHYDEALHLHGPIGGFVAKSWCEL
jgi:hypothetical protein